VLVTPFRWEPDGLGAPVIFVPDDAKAFEGDVEYARGIADITVLAVGYASRFEDMEQTAAGLRAVDEMKNTFIDALSPELRNPLAAMLGIALTPAAPGHRPSG
jgi:signal transduction histidine kinase